MNKEQLIKTLLEQDLELFKFSVWATYEKDELEFAFCECGSKPSFYEIHICDIGGSPFVEYNYEYLELLIDEAIDNYYYKSFEL